MKIASKLNLESYEDKVAKTDADINDISEIIEKIEKMQAATS